MFLLLHFIIKLLQGLGLFVLLIIKEILSNIIIFIANLLENWSKSPIDMIVLNEFNCPLNLDPIIITKLYIYCQKDWDNNLIMQDINISNFFKIVNDKTFEFRNFKISPICSISKLNTVKRMIKNVVI